MGENIGAVARAMKNFGLRDLRIVSPRDGWPNQKADSVAVEAVSILRKAEIYEDLGSAISDLEYIYATTATKRYMNKDYVSSNNLYEDLPQNSKIGFLFGRESSGLTNEEIVMSNKILTIETGEEFSSLNLSHAVSIICYELFGHRGRSGKIENIQTLATKGEVDYLLKSLIEELDKKGFFKVQDKKPEMVKNITNIFSRIDKLSKTEVQTLTGIVKDLSRES